MMKDRSEILRWDTESLKTMGLSASQSELIYEHVSGWGPGPIFQLHATFKRADGSTSKVSPFEVEVSLHDADGAELGRNDSVAMRNDKFFPGTANVRVPVPTSSDRYAKRVAHAIASVKPGAPSESEPEEVPVIFDAESARQLGVEILGVRAHWKDDVFGPVVHIQLRCSATGTAAPVFDAAILDAAGFPCASHWPELETLLDEDAPGEYFGEVERQCSASPSKVNIRLRSPVAAVEVESQDESYGTFKFDRDNDGTASSREGEFELAQARRAIQSLRDWRSDERLAKGAIADVLDDILSSDAEGAAVVRAVADSVFAKEKTPYAEVLESRWSWPRPEWEDWAESMAAVLGNSPSQMWRDLIIDLPDGAWCQIYGSAGQFGVLIYDPTEAFGELTSLAWSSRQEQGFPGVYWDHDYSMTYESGAVDRAAQAIALVVGVPSPEELPPKPQLVGGKDHPSDDSRASDDTS